MGESGFCEEAFDIVDNSQEVFLDSTSGRIVLRSGNCAPDSSPLENYDNQQCERPLKRSDHHVWEWWWKSWTLVEDRRPSYLKVIIISKINKFWSIFLLALKIFLLALKIFQPQVEIFLLVQQVFQLLIEIFLLVFKIILAPVEICLLASSTQSISSAATSICRGWIVAWERNLYFHCHSFSLASKSSSM